MEHRFEITNDTVRQLGLSYEQTIALLMHSAAKSSVAAIVPEFGETILSNFGDGKRITAKDMVRFQKKWRPDYPKDVYEIKSDFGSYSFTAESVFSLLDKWTSEFKIKGLFPLYEKPDAIAWQTGNADIRKMELGGVLHNGLMIGADQYCVVAKPFECPEGIDEDARLVKGIFGWLDERKMPYVDDMLDDNFYFILGDWKSVFGPVPSALKKMAADRGEGNPQWVYKRFVGDLATYNVNLLYLANGCKAITKGLKDAEVAIKKSASGKQTYLRIRKDDVQVVIACFVETGQNEQYLYL